MTVDQNLEREALALLRARGYVCLTREEAAKVRGALAAHNSAVVCREGLTETLAAVYSEAFALLQPEEER